MRSIILNPGFFIGSLEIKYYGLIIAFSMIIALVVALLSAKKRNIKPDELISLALWVIPFSIVGARIYYVAFSDYSYTFVEALKIWEGGMAIYGGVIAGAITVAVWCKIKKKHFLSFCDVIVPALIIAQALGRWGNFVNQEAFGPLVTNESLQWFPFSVYIDSLSEWHLATFFYESMWNIVGFVILMLILFYTKKKGVVLASYLAYYGLGRLLIEGLREDSLMLWGIRVSQLVSGLMIAGGVVWLGIIIGKEIRKRKEEKKKIAKGEQNEFFDSEERL